VRRKPKVRLVPLIDGGGHEKGMRSGTIDVPGVVGLGAACALAEQERPAEAARLLALRTLLHERIATRLQGVHVNGTLEHRLPGNLNLSFDGIEGEALLLAPARHCDLLGLGVQLGVDRALARDSRARGGADRAHASIRFGIGRFNTEEEVRFVADQVVATVTKLRELATAEGFVAPPALRRDR
jgi:cysteine desulfurase